VLAAIRAHAGEWRDAALPAELRERGVIAVEARVRGRSFRLRYAAGYRRLGSDVAVAGSVEPAAGGGSHVTARCGLDRSPYAPGIVLAVGAALWASGAGPFLAAGVVLGGVALITGGNAARERAITRESDAAAGFLAARLEHAVASARGGEDGAAHAPVV